MNTLIILRIYNCSNLFFNVSILYYSNFVLIFNPFFYFFTGPALIAVFFKLM